MMDQYFGHKELREVVIRAKTPMHFGDRYIEAEEPILYFDDINMSMLSESNKPVFARGGWGNMPRVIWEERSEVAFQLVDGVMSSVGMGILLGSNVISNSTEEPLYVHMKEGPFTPNIHETIINNDTVEVPYIDIQHEPVNYPIKKVFIFEYDRKAIQQGIYGKLLNDIVDGYGNPVYRIELYEDKNLTIPAKNNRKFLIDYYYKYRDEALIYSVQKERFNGLFTLEGKFYSKDENEGQNYVNLLYMPKVRIVSNIDLRLGERADPTVSTFNIIGMPETAKDQKNLIMNITRLGEPIYEDI